MLADFAELQNRRLRLVARIRELKILHRRLRDPPVEVQAVRLHLFVPARLFVSQHDQIFDVRRRFPFQRFQDAPFALRIRRTEDGATPAGFVDSRYGARHDARALRAQHVVLVSNRAEFGSRREHTRGSCVIAAEPRLGVGGIFAQLDGARLSALVEDGELGADEVRAKLPEKVPALPVQVLLVQGDDVVRGGGLFASPRAQQKHGIVRGLAGRRARPVQVQKVLRVPLAADAEHAPLAVPAEDVALHRVAVERRGLRQKHASVRDLHDRRPRDAVRMGSGSPRRDVRRPGTVPEAVSRSHGARAAPLGRPRALQGQGFDSGLVERHDPVGIARHMTRLVMSSRRLRVREPAVTRVATGDAGRRRGDAPRRRRLEQRVRANRARPFSHDIAPRVLVRVRADARRPRLRGRSRTLEAPGRHRARGRRGTAARRERA